MTQGQAAKHDFINDQKQQKQALTGCIQQLKTKLVQCQKQFSLVNTATSILKSEYETLCKVKSIRADKMAQVRSNTVNQEIRDLECDVKELRECKAVLRSELVSEDENIRELGTIIAQLKRNLHDAKRDRDRAV